MILFCTEDSRGRRMKMNLTHLQKLFYYLGKFVCLSPFDIKNDELRPVNVFDKVYSLAPIALSSLWQWNLLPDICDAKFQSVFSLTGQGNATKVEIHRVWNKFQPEALRDEVRSLGLVARKVKQRIRELLPNPEEWTDFRMEPCGANTYRKFHMERNVQVCEELLDHGTIRCARYDPAKNHCNVGRVLIPADLLREVVAMRYRNAPTEFCCFSDSDSSEGSCSLSIKDAKRLLKDSSYQLSSLHLSHTVEINCDVHLIALAFPYLTELHLAGIVLDGDWTLTRSWQRLSKDQTATEVIEISRFLPIVITCA